MKKILLVIISLYIALNPVLVKASTDRHERKVYVRIKKEELELLQRQALISEDILDRLTDLEKLFRSMSTTLSGTVSMVETIKKMLNISDTTTPTTPTTNTNPNKVELASGMVLTPGFVSYKAKVYDSSKSFSGLGLKTLDFDIYYNKTLFTLDHIEGDGIAGNEFKFISLPQSSSGAKDRVQIPVSDLLAKEVEFDLYFVPRNMDLAKVNDDTKVEVKNYKRAIKDINGNSVHQVIYELGLNSPDFIKVTKK